MFDLVNLIMLKKFFICMRAFWRWKFRMDRFREEWFVFMSSCEMWFFPQFCFIYNYGFKVFLILLKELPCGQSDNSSWMLNSISDVNFCYMGTVQTFRVFHFKSERIPGWFSFVIVRNILMLYDLRRSMKMESVVERLLKTLWYAFSDPRVNKL